MNRKTVQRVLVLLFGLAFIGSTAFMLVGSLFSNDSQPSASTSTATGSSEQEQLQAQIRGYEKVLTREPNNPTALQGLVQARLALQDLPGAMEPLEKLVQLYPQEPELKALLEAVKQQSAQNPQPKP
jgi:cytochrome c-type biogenesis protein CcmH/NrfG